MRRRSLGVDLDGVLANQIDGVLPRIKSLYGIDLRYEDITHWRLPTGPSDIATEIVASQTEREYVLSMPVHPGAHEMLVSLADEFRIVVLTARAGDALNWSVDWLNLHELPFDEFAGSTEAKKSLHGVDALVDDFLGNVAEFLANSDGPAILVDQPWNRDEREDELAGYLDVGRVAVVSSLGDVAPTLRALFETRSTGAS